MSVWRCCFEPKKGLYQGYRQHWYCVEGYIQSRILICFPALTCWAAASDTIHSLPPFLVRLFRLQTHEAKSFIQWLYNTLHNTNLYLKPEDPSQIYKNVQEWSCPAWWLNGLLNAQRKKCQRLQISSINEGNSSPPKVMHKGMHKMAFIRRTLTHLSQYCASLENLNGFFPMNSENFVLAPCVILNNYTWINKRKSKKLSLLRKPA